MHCFLYSIRKLLSIVYQNWFLASEKFGKGKESALMIHDFHSGVNFDIIVQSVSLEKMGSSSTCLFLGKKSKLVPDSCLNNSSSGCSGVAETPRALIWLQGKTIPTKTEPNLSLSLLFPFSDYLSRILPKKAINNAGKNDDG